MQFFILLLSFSIDISYIYLRAINIYDILYLYTTHILSWIL